MGVGRIRVVASRYNALMRIKSVEIEPVVANADRVAQVGSVYREEGINGFVKDICRPVP